MHPTLSRLLLATGSTLVAATGLTLMSVAPASADPICAGVLVTSMLSPLEKEQCVPYTGPTRCEFLGAGLQPTVYATVTTCVPAL